MEADKENQSGVENKQGQEEQGVPEAAQPEVKELSKAEKKVIETTQLLDEIVSTETTYLTGLTQLVEHHQSLIAFFPKKVGKIKTHDALNTLNNKIKPIKDVQSALSEILSRSAATPEASSDQPQAAALNEQEKQAAQLSQTLDAFESIIPYLRPYVNYVSFYTDNAFLLGNLDAYIASEKGQKKIGALQPSAFKTWMSAKGARINPIAITPIQRVPRYKMLLEAIAKNLPDAHPQKARAQAMLGRISESALLINEQTKVLDHQQAIQSDTRPAILFSNTALNDKTQGNLKGLKGKKTCNIGNYTVSKRNDDFDITLPGAKKARFKIKSDTKQGIIIVPITKQWGTAAPITRIEIYQEMEDFSRVLAAEFTPTAENSPPVKVQVVEADKLKQGKIAETKATPPKLSKEATPQEQIQGKFRIFTAQQKPAITAMLTKQQEITTTYSRKVFQRPMAKTEVTDKFTTAQAPYQSLAQAYQEHQSDTQGKIEKLQAQMMTMIQEMAAYQRQGADVTTMQTSLDAMTETLSGLTGRLAAEMKAVQGVVDNRTPYFAQLKDLDGIVTQLKGTPGNKADLLEQGKAIRQQLEQLDEAYDQLIQANPVLRNISDLKAIDTALKNSVVTEYRQAVPPPAAKSRRAPPPARTQKAHRPPPIRTEAQIIKASTEKLGIHITPTQNEGKFTRTTTPTVEGFTIGQRSNIADAIQKPVTCNTQKLTSGDPIKLYLIRATDQSEIKVEPDTEQWANRENRQAIYNAMKAFTTAYSVHLQYAAEINVGQINDQGGLTTVAELTKPDIDYAGQVTRVLGEVKNLLKSLPKIKMIPAKKAVGNPENGHSEHMLIRINEDYQAFFQSNQAPIKEINEKLISCVDQYQKLQAQMTRLSQQPEQQEACKTAEKKLTALNQKITALEKDLTEKKLVFQAYKQNRNQYLEVLNKIEGHGGCNEKLETLAKTETATWSKENSKEARKLIAQSHAYKIDLIPLRGACKALLAANSWLANAVSELESDTELEQFVSDASDNAKSGVYSKIAGHITAGIAKVAVISDAELKPSGNVHDYTTRLASYTTHETAQTEQLDALEAKLAELETELAAVKGEAKTDVTEQITSAREAIAQKKELMAHHKTALEQGEIVMGVEGSLGATTDDHTIKLSSELDQKENPDIQAARARYTELKSGYNAHKEKATKQLSEKKKSLTQVKDSLGEVAPEGAPQATRDLAADLRGRIQNIEPKIIEHETKITKKSAFIGEVVKNRTPYFQALTNLQNNLAELEGLLKTSRKERKTNKIEGTEKIYQARIEELEQQITSNWGELKGHQEAFEEQLITNNASMAGVLGIQETDPAAQKIADKLRDHHKAIQKHQRSYFKKHVGTYGARVVGLSLLAAEILGGTGLLLLSLGVVTAPFIPAVGALVAGIALPFALPAIALPIAVGVLIGVGVVGVALIVRSFVTGRQKYMQEDVSKELEIVGGELEAVELTDFAKPGSENNLREESVQGAVQGSVSEHGAPRNDGSGKEPDVDIRIN